MISVVLSVLVTVSFMCLREGMLKVADHTEEEEEKFMKEIRSSSSSELYSD